MLVKLSYPIFEGTLLQSASPVQTRIIPARRIANGDLVNFPDFIVSAAKFIIKKTKLRGVAMGFMSVDSSESTAAGNYIAHHILLGQREVTKRNILIIEDANITPILGKKVKRVFAVPLPLKDVDDSPINMFAEIA